MLPIFGAESGGVALNRKAYLDGWRGLSILLVLIGHFTLLPAAGWARLGVELFFALSGRLMADILFVQHFPAKVFLWRRFSRVWPALLAFLTVMMIVSRLTSVLGPPLGWGTAGALATFTYNYARVIAGAGWHAGEHFWSLCVEEHSYIVLLLVAGSLAGAFRSHLCCWQLSSFYRSQTRPYAVLSSGRVITRFTG